MRVMGKLDTEVELLVRCVDPTVEGDPGEGIRSLLATGPDWERLLGLASVHGVVPSLNRTLGSRFESVVAPAVRSSLEERARTIALQNVRLAGELRDIADAFEESGVRWLPFKGPVLAETAYGDVARRDFRDLDLLVSREDASRAVDCLESRGYEWRDGVPRRDDSALLGGPFTKPLTAEYTLYRDGIEVEVRCSVGAPDRPFTPTVGTLRSRRSSVGVAGRELPALSPEDRLLVLAFHGTKHRWHLLKWICDFGAAASTDVDWSVVLRRARRHGTERKLRIGVELVDALFGIDVPADVRPDDERADDLARQVIDDLAEGRPTRPSKRERTVYNARASDSLGDCLPILLYFGKLRPGVPEYRLLPLPGVLHPLYYLLFPIRAVTVLCIRSIRGFRGNSTEL